MVRPIIEMSKLSVGQDLANLNTRSCSLRIRFDLIWYFFFWGSFTVQLAIGVWEVRFDWLIEHVDYLVRIRFDLIRFDFI